MIVNEHNEFIDPLTLNFNALDLKLRFPSQIFSVFNV